MAITLPDIVQRVVLDTRQFSAKKLGKELADTSQQASKASTSLAQVERANKSAGTSSEVHEGKIKRLNNAVRGAAPSFLRMADNLYKVRLRSEQTQKSQSKLLSTLKGGAVTVAKFAGKFALIGAAVLTAIPAIGALVGGIMALIGSMGRGLGVLPAFGAGLIALIGTAIMAKTIFGGLKDAIKAQTETASGGASTAKAVASAQKSAYKQIASASKAVVEARKEEQRAYADIAKVHYEHSRRIEDANRAVIDAERDLVRSKYDVEAAQEKLNRSYEEAADYLRDLERSSKRAHLSERQAALDLAEARADLAKAGKDEEDPGEAARDRAQALLRLEGAELDLIDAKERRQELDKQLAEDQAKGVKGSDIVAEATNNLTEAQEERAAKQQALTDAERDSLEASVEGWTAVTEANEKAAEATLKVKESIAELAEAHADGAQSIRDAMSSGSSAAPKKDDSSPAMKAFAATIIAARKELKGLKAESQAIALPGVSDAVKLMVPNIKALKPQMDGASRLIGDMAKQWAVNFTMVRGEIARTWDTGTNFGSSLNDLGGSLFRAAMRIFDAARPVLDLVGAAARDLGTKIEEATTSSGAFERMQGFFIRALESLMTWWHIIRDTTIGIVNIFSAGADAGDTLATRIETVVARFREWTGDEANQAKMRDFFDKAKEALAFMSRLIGQVALGFGQIATGPALGALKDLFKTIFGGSTDDLSGVSDFIGKLGTEAIVSGANAIENLIKMFRGDKPPTEDYEKLATAFVDLKDLGAPLEVFAEVVSKLVGAIKWGSEHIPGFNAAFGIMAGLMAVGKITGFTKAAGGIGRLTASLVGLFQTQKFQRGTVDNLKTLNSTADRMAGNMGRAATQTDRVTRSMGVPVTPFVSSIEKADVAADKAARSHGRLGGAVQKLSGAAGGMAAVGGIAGMIGMSVGGEAGGMLTKLSTALWGIGGTLEMASLAQGVFATSTEAGAVATEAGTVAQGTFMASVKATSASLLASPITWIVVGLVAMGAALYALYKNNEGFRKFIDELWQSIQRGWDIILAKLKEFAGWVKDKIVPILITVGTFLRDLFVTIGQGAAALWTNYLYPAFQAISGFVTGTLIPILQSLWSGFQTGVSALGTALSWVWSTILQPIFEALGYIIVNILVPFFQTLWRVVSAVFDGIGKAISWAWNNVIKPIFDVIWYVITNILIPIFQTIWKVVSEVFDAVGKAIGWAWNNVIKPIFDLLWGFITETLVPAFQEIWDVAKVAWEGIETAVSAAWELVKPVFEGIRNWIRDDLIPVFEDIGRIGSSVWGAIAEAIPAAFGRAKELLKVAVKPIGDILSGILGVAAEIADVFTMTDFAGKIRSTASKIGSWGEASPGSGIGAGVGAVAAGIGGFVGSTANAARAASGGVFDNAGRREVGSGFKTGTPRAIVGEGSRHPEYVIPTDPKYRPRAFDLLQSLMGDLTTGPSGRWSGGAGGKGDGLHFGIGGLLGDGIDAVKKLNPVDGIYKLYDMAREAGGAALAAMIPKVPESMLGQNFMGIPGNMVNTVRTKIVDWAKKKSIEEGEKQIAAAQAGANASGLDPTFLGMYYGYNENRGGKFSIYSGWRSYQKQVQLYNDYLAGHGNLAARPGTSRHEKGLAIDHTPGSNAGDRSAARGFKLHYPVLSKGEDWHVEPMDIAGTLAETRRRGMQTPTTGPGGATSGSGGGSLQQMAQMALDARGWGGQWGALNNLITKESGWNPTAQNPSSTAYGLFQFLDKTWTEGKTSDPESQIRQGLNYIANKYVDPAGAWAHWQRKGSYASGGILGNVPQLAHGGIATDDTLARIGEMGRKEAIVPLDSPRGRRMLGEEGGTPSIMLDMRHMQINEGDPTLVKKAVKEAVDEALDAVAELVEIGIS